MNKVESKSAQMIKHMSFSSQEQIKLALFIVMKEKEKYIFKKLAEETHHLFELE